MVAVTAGIEDTPTIYVDWCGLIDCSGRVFNFFIDILRDTTHI